MKTLAVVAGIAVASLAPAWAASPLHIVAAENFYGDVAEQIGGANVQVSSVLSNPDQDPHLFEASPSVARNLSAARIVVYSGLDYDPWMPKLLGASGAPGRREIVVADLIGGKAGDNPHIWYEPATMLAFAQALTDALVADDPTNRDGYERRLAGFQASIKPIEDQIARLRQRLAGTPVTATEPVFGYMFEALGMRVRNESFQLAVMNDTEPSASDIAAFEDDLKTHRVSLLVYNSQASDPIAKRLEELAKASGVLVIGAGETMPAGSTYQAWMARELDAIDKALPAATQ